MNDPEQLTPEEAARLAAALDQAEAARVELEAQHEAAAAQGEAVLNPPHPG